MSGPRIAIGGFMHETNTFAPSMAGFEAFIEGGGWPTLSEGPALISATRNVNMGICGFVETAEAQGWDLVPILWCAASPSAHVTEDAFERIARRIVEGVRAAGRLDGVYLDLHGAMVAEHVDDGEGELLERVREVIGPDLPLVASLDLHANVTRRMVDMADALIAYRTYPHVDMAETGRRSALYMERLLSGRRDAKAFRQVPFLIPIAWQCTGMEPGRSLYARLPALEERGIASASLLMGFPAADFADCGPSVLAYATSREGADQAADELLEAVIEQETAFSGDVFSPMEGVLRAMELAERASRPIVIADTQDNPGAGGNSDTTGMLRALVEAGAKRAAIGVIVDPEAAARAHEAGVGARLRLPLGGKSAIAGDAPFEAEYVVESLSDGRLTASGPYYGGARMQLGPSTCLRVGDVRIVVASRKAQMADQAMYRFVGIEPREQAILINKSSVHFRADFEPIAEAIIVCAAPGPMPADPAALPFTKLRQGVRLSPNGPVFG
ncbi:M81 family metallopeptidase [Microvirga makkahensis]|nr:M81 family metallopeptidase [Microvirga makkahensis]